MTADAGPGLAVPAAAAGELALEQRISAILGVAAGARTGVRIRELAELLPEDAPASPAELSSWLARRPMLAELRHERAYAPGIPVEDPDPERGRRGERFWQTAVALKGSSFRPLLPLLLAIGVTGSTAYGEPQEDDDLDLMLITREGSLWIVLALAYLAVRFRPPSGEARPAPGRICLNFVRESGAARREFATPQDFLFAREALAARMVWGEEYYAELLAGAPWIGRELPKLYEGRRTASAAPSGRDVRAPWPIRLANAVVFPILAAYLQAQGLRRNARLRRRGEIELRYRTETRLDRLTYASERFERTRAAYLGSSVPPPTPAAVRRMIPARAAPLDPRSR